MLRSPPGLRKFSLMQFSPLILSPDISNTEFDWQPLASHSMVPSAILRQWLQDEGSLTKQLTALSANQFQVKLVSEAWVHLVQSDLLGQFGPVGQGHRFWSRKVLLLGKGEEWVAAHTLIPEHSFLSPLQQVMRLQSKPLGEFLFSHPDLLRSEMVFTPAAEQGWGRRSLFFLYQKPVMVAEFFLPALIATLDRLSAKGS